MTKKKNTKAESPSSPPVFAEKLKAMRLTKNWSLRDAEKRTGAQLSRQTFLRAEQGDVALDNLLKMLRLYNSSSAETTLMLELWSKTQLTKARADVKADKLAEVAA